MKSKIKTLNKKELPTTKELWNLHNDGYTILCPRCHAKIFFNDTEIGCSRNTNHFYIISCRKLSPKVKNKLDRMRMEESIANMKKRGCTEDEIQEKINRLYSHLF